MSRATPDLVGGARRAMLKHGFDPEFPDAVMREVTQLERTPDLHARPAGCRDERHLLWSSIDNRTSRDLDQIEVAEPLADDVIRLRVAVADVDALAGKGTALDTHAARNTATIYTGVAVYPMLPNRLSTDLTSLNPQQDRLAVVVQIDVNPDGTVVDERIYRALVRNRAQLVYESVSRWLDGDGDLPAAAAAVPGIEEQLRLQAEAARRLRALREQHGTLSLESVEPQLLLSNGKVVDIYSAPPDRAREIIENLMVAANGAMARFLNARQIPALRRIVRAPKRWSGLVALAAELGETLPATPDGPALGAFLNRRREADGDHFADLSLAVVKLLGPGEYILERRMDAARRDGHFGLGVAEYVHGTAPNRRYADLIIQRLAKAACANDGRVYGDEELQAVARRCTELEKSARKVERLVRKQAAASFLESRVGDTFTAVVTGASEKGTYVRVLSPPVEGRLVRHQRGLDVGDTVRVKLVRADAEAGHVDFEGPPPDDLQRKRDRTSRKRRAATSLSARVGESFDATVTAVSPKGTYVRLLDGSAEGRVVRGHGALAVGQVARVRLVATDALHGFIDFEFAEGLVPRKVERTRRKQAWARTLRERVGERFDAVVTSATAKATYVQLSPSGIEGRLVRPTSGAAPGQRIGVVLLRADTRNGFIDFCEADGP